MTRATRDGAYFCQWCAVGDHHRCTMPEKVDAGGQVTKVCACDARAHVPDIKLGRMMLRSQCPDMRPAIDRGVYDDQIRRVHAQACETGAPR